MNIDEYREITTPNPKLLEIDNLVEFAPKTYLELRNEYKLSCNDGEYWDGNVSDYLSFGVELEWEYSWNYGGQASGTNYIPVEALVGSEEKRVEYIKSVVLKEYELDLKTKSTTAESEKAKRKKEFEKLKREFE